MDTLAQPLRVTVKRIDTNLPLPTYATAGSVGFDLLCREDGNVIVKTPPGYLLLLTLRSSTPRRKGLLIPHGIGVIDQDYSGNSDELMVQVYNFLDVVVLVKRGERIAQGIFVPLVRVAWNEVHDMGEGRGGFGSTGA